MSKLECQPLSFSSSIIRTMGVITLATGIGTGAVVPEIVSAQPTCTFQLGFKTLHDMIPNTIGNCLDNEHHNSENGDGLQHTTEGLLVWRKADNWTAFTDGYRTWINGPFGLQTRLNTERFDWETPIPSTEQSGPSYPKEVGILQRDGIVLHNLSNEIGVIITDQPYFQEKIVPLIKKYRPQGVEFFFHDGKIPLKVPNQGYKSYRISDYFLESVAGSFLGYTGIVFAERAGDAVLEVHYQLRLTNRNPSPEAIRSMSSRISGEGIERHFLGNENLRQPDVLATDLEMGRRSLAGIYPIFALVLNTGAQPQPAPITQLENTNLCKPPGPHERTPSYPAQIGTFTDDRIVINNLANDIGITITDETFFKNNIVPLVKKYRPNGVEFFFHNTLSNLSIPNIGYKSYEAFGHTPGGTSNCSFIDDTPFILAERERDGVLEVHYGLFVTNYDADSAIIKEISFVVEKYVIMRYFIPNRDLQHDDVVATTSRMEARYNRGEKPIFMLTLGK